MQLTSITLKPSSVLATSITNASAGVQPFAVRQSFSPQQWACAYSHIGLYNGVSFPIPLYITLPSTRYMLPATTFLSTTKNRASSMIRFGLATITTVFRSTVVYSSRTAYSPSRHVSSSSPFIFCPLKDFESSTGRMNAVPSKLGTSPNLQNLASSFNIQGPHFSCRTRMSKFPFLKTPGCHPYFLDAASTVVVPQIIVGVRPPLIVPSTHSIS